MAEIIVGPMLFAQAKKYLVELMEESGAFRGGSKPAIGRLKKSYGFGKIVGCKSFDNKVSTRLDYDEENGYHFNFVNSKTGEKICMIIEDMSQEQYEKYIDSLTTGRNTEIIPKGPIIKYRKGTNDRIYYALQNGELSYLDVAITDGYLIDKNLEDHDYENAYKILSTFYDIGKDLGFDTHDIFEIDDSNDEIIIFDYFYFEYLIKVVLMKLNKRNRNNDWIKVTLKKLITEIKPIKISVDNDEIDELKERIKHDKFDNISKKDSTSENKKHGR